MGNSINKPQRALTQMTCQDDTVCKNIDSKRSTVDNIIYTCPMAACVDGTCQCGPGCERDPYTGMCCSKVIKSNGTTFCEENPWVRPTPVCKVPDQVINGVKISGKQVCQIYNKYQQ